MTEGYLKPFCVSHSQLALWCSGYDSLLRISRLLFRMHDFMFLEKKGLEIN